MLGSRTPSHAELASSACHAQGLLAQKGKAGVVPAPQPMTSQTTTELLRVTPAGAEITWDKAKLHASIGREPLHSKTAEVLATFADGKPAVTRNRFGKGQAIVAGLWSGLSYSAKVRRSSALWR